MNLDLLATLSIRRDLALVADVRRWAANALDGYACSAVAVRWLSELVASSIQHADGDDVSVGIFEHGAAIRVQVIVGCSQDHVPRLTERFTEASVRLGGIGPHIVSDLADDWGSVPVAGGLMTYFVIAKTPSREGRGK